jgi:hypothetical protein
VDEGTLLGNSLSRDQTWVGLDGRGRTPGSRFSKPFEAPEIRAPG